jgi:hypothetical protein
VLYGGSARCSLPEILRVAAAEYPIEHVTDNALSVHWASLAEGQRQLETAMSHTYIRYRSGELMNGWRA